ncbi:MAG: HAMP domain-containing sensor histidine kinase [Cellulosilyticaceae bacterium]
MGKNWKVVGMLIIGFCIMLSMGVSASYLAYQKIDQMYYEQIAGIVGKVVAQNPENEVLVVQGLKELEARDVERGKEILKPYGYEAQFLVLPYNKKGFESLLWVNMMMLTLIFLIGVGVSYGIYRWLKVRLSALLAYLMQIAKGDYSLNIKGIGEGAFSVFEDQIYKTTLVLREGKETQEKEKLNLAQNIADISHQLKTPLTSMGIMTDLLLENEVSDQNQQFIKQLNLQIERLSKLVGILLKLAKLDAGTVQLKEQEVVVSTFIEEVVEMLEGPIRQKQLKIHMTGEDDVCVLRDKNWMYEAIHNILCNCVQHSPVGSKLTIEWHHNPIYTEIVIQDEGGGVPVKDLPHIFTRFYKGENASKESVGIGLAMAKTIIEKQNGEIKVANANGGAQFRMKFY